VSEERRKKEREEKGKRLGYLYEKITIADGLAFPKRKDTNVLISSPKRKLEHVSIFM